MKLTKSAARLSSRTLSLAVVLSFAVCLIQGCSSSSPGMQPPAQNPAPVLTSISPITASMGSAGITLTATGTSFMQSSQIAWNGAPLTTTFISSTELQAQIPASSLASAASISVNVITPPPGGGSSKALSFTILVITTNVNILDVARRRR